MINQEIKNRIKISVAAYAYEYLDAPIMSDGDFDALSQLIDTKKKTGNEKLDKFFEKHFVADSGMWIHKHPEKEKLKYLYEEFYT
tara:strand:- start:1706 stop:1960 length:255 start_codon:yes stop_codon:yes gene_type:complete